jgi:pyruvate/2-oxoglutarate dehydrogenase complex dihydrolipoamide acyltransferase (E2) component
LSSTRGVPPLTGDRFQFDARDDAIERDIDLPLRAETVDDDVTLPDAEDEPEPSSGRGVAAGMLVIGLLCGFVAGFVAGQRMAPPLPASVAEAPKAPASSAAPESAAAIAEPAVIDDAGAQATDIEQRVRTGNAPAGDQNRPAAVAAAPAPAPSPTPQPQATRVEPPRAPASAAPAPGSAQPAMLDLATRPSGATVFLDDVRVGVTPVTINDVAPGSRRIRLELEGHQPWSTSVDVKVGAHVRIGASLE